MFAGRLRSTKAQGNQGFWLWRKKKAIVGQSNISSPAFDSKGLALASTGGRNINQTQPGLIHKLPSEKRLVALRITLFQIFPRIARFRLGILTIYAAQVSKLSKRAGCG
jgi:hypothetical protein